MGWISWIILGALAGWLASKIMGVDDYMGAFANIGVGIVGGFIGGLIVNLISGGYVLRFNLFGLLVALLGSVIFIWLMKKIRGR